MSPPCLLCLGRRVSPVFQEGTRVYHACAQCELRFLDPSSRLPADRERARYLQHDNDIGDPGYRNFARPLYEQVRAHVRPGAAGLDFGAGPGPVLADLFTRAGYPIRVYDPFFHPDRGSLQQQYEFIVACEVVEHLREPRAEFRLLRSLLVPGGLLGVMTWLWDGTIDFAQWSYRRDPTHVAFYSRATFRRIAALWRFAEVWFPEDRVVLLRA